VQLPLDPLSQTQGVDHAITSRAAMPILLAPQRISG
jgi:hypothetical protein